jgi:hypothetical protein
MPLPDFGLDLGPQFQVVSETSKDLDTAPTMPGLPVYASNTSFLYNSTANNMRPSASLAHLPDVTDLVRYRVKTKEVFICTYANCNKEFGRKPELYRHHRGAHKKERPFKCQASNCERSVRGFPRRDKRDEHFKKMHW